MASNTDDEQQIASEFDTVHNLFGEVKQQYFATTDSFRYLSMGMSGDYLIAQQHGSNMVRVGTMIFGSRNYN